jgi:hypothetical protein
MITTHMRGYLVKAGDTPCRVPIPVDLHWSEADPAAFSMAFNVGPEDDGITWLASYDLLAEAMTCDTPVGDGDVRLRRENFAKVLFVCLKGQDGHADIALPVGPVEDFLNQSQLDVDLAQDLIPAQMEEFIREVLGGR